MANANRQSAPLAETALVTDFSKTTPSYLFMPLYNQNFQLFELPKDAVTSQLSNYYISLSDKFKTILNQRRICFKTKFQEAQGEKDSRFVSFIKILNQNQKNSLISLQSANIDKELTQYCFELCMCVANGSLLPHRASEFIIKRLGPAFNIHLDQVQQDFNYLHSESYITPSTTDPTIPDDTPEINSQFRKSNSNSLNKLNEESKIEMNSTSDHNNFKRRKIEREFSLAKESNNSGTPLKTTNLKKPEFELNKVRTDNTNNAPEGSSNKKRSRRSNPNSKFETEISTPESFHGNVTQSNAIIDPSLPYFLKSLILDAIWLIWEMIDNLPSSSHLIHRARTNITNFCATLDRDKGINLRDIISYLDPAKLDSIKYVKFELKGGLQGLNVKERTKRFYTLSTHNLLRDHTTGFTKLHVFLTELVFSNTRIDINISKRIIFKIVGHYALCPSRTLGMILDIYENHLYSLNQLLPLISMFSKNKITEVICFQMNLFTESIKARDHEIDLPFDYQVIDNNSVPWLNKVNYETLGPSSNFYRLAAILLVHGLLEFETFYKFLEPADALLRELMLLLNQKYYKEIEDVKAGKNVTIMKGSPPTSNVRSSTSDNFGMDTTKLYSSFDPNTSGYSTPISSHLNNSQALTPLSGTPYYSHLTHGLYGHTNPQLLGKLDRERYERENQDKQLRDKKEKEKQWLESEIKRKREIKEKYKDNPLFHLPGFNDYFFEDDICYKFLCDHIFTMFIGKFQLIAALLDINGWYLAKSILDHMNKNLLCQPFYNHVIFRALKDYIKWMISPLLHKTKTSFQYFLLKRLSPQSKRLRSQSSINQSYMFSQENIENTIKHNIEFEPSRMPLYWLGLLFSQDCKKIDHNSSDPKPMGLRPVNTFEGFFIIVVPLISYLGHYLYLDPTLFISILNILEHHIIHNKNTYGEEEYSKQLDELMLNTLLPAMSYSMEGNSQLSDHIFRILSHISSIRRHRIYSRYYYDKIFLELPPVSYTYETVRGKIRKLLKRTTSDLLKDTKNIHVRVVTWEITGLSATNPFPVVSVIVDQCEMFDENMVYTLTEATKNVNPLTGDVFAHRLIERQQTRELRASGKWDPGHLDIYAKPKKLVNMGILAGRFFRRHPMVEISPILFSSLYRLCCEFSPSTKITPTSLHGRNESYPKLLQGYFLDKEFLEQLLELMGGVAKLPESHALTEDQIFAQGGGAFLRTEIMLSGEEDSGPKSFVKKAIISAIQDPNYIRMLLFTLSKLKSELLFDSQFSKSLKLFGSILDDVQWFNLQFIAFLQQMLSPHIYSHFIPTVKEIFQYFEYAMAWYILRHCLSINTGFKDYSNYSSLTLSEHEDFDEERVDIASTNGSLTESQDNQNTRLMTDLQPIIKTYISEESLSGLSWGIYFTFWKLSLSEIFVPNEQYKKMIDKLDSSIKQNEKKIEEISRNSRNSFFNSINKNQNERDENHFSRKLKKLHSRRSSLKKEWNSLSQHHEKVLSDLKEQCSTWISHHRAGPYTSRAIVKYMIAPRLLNSEADALFCGFFINLLVKMKTPLFNLFDFTNAWTKMVTPLVRSCTEREAQLLGIFVNEMIRPINFWLTNEEQFKKDSTGNPCFGMSFKPKPDNTLKHEQLIIGSKKWEGRIFKPLKSGLEFFKEDEHHKIDWSDQKSIIVFLSRCHENFPLTYDTGHQIKERLKDVAANAMKRGWNDIKLSANSLVQTFEKYEQSNKWYNSPTDKQCVVSNTEVQPNSLLINAIPRENSRDSHKKEDINMIKKQSPPRPRNAFDSSSMSELAAIEEKTKTPSNNIKHTTYTSSPSNMSESKNFPTAAIPLPLSDTHIKNKSSVPAIFKEPGSHLISSQHSTIAVNIPIREKDLTPPTSIYSIKTETTHSKNNLSSCQLENENLNKSLTQATNHLTKTGTLSRAHPNISNSSATYPSTTLSHNKEIPIAIESQFKVSDSTQNSSDQRLQKRMRIEEGSLDIIYPRSSNSVLNRPPDLNLNSYQFQTSTNHSRTNSSLSGTEFINNPSTNSESSPSRTSSALLNRNPSN